MAGKDVVPHPDHFESLKEATITDNATVQGMLMNVSPMKKGQSPYFEAKLTDGEDQMRVVGFSSSLRKRMAGLEERYEPVALESCKIKRGKYSEQLEVMINPSTKFSTSPKKFDLRKISKMICGDVSVSDVDSKTAYDKVTIQAKVLQVQLPVDVSPQLKKQEITVADSTAAIKVTLWEASIDSVQKDKSYKFKNFTVRTYKYEKYISMPKEGAEIIEIDDVGIDCGR